MSTMSCISLKRRCICRGSCRLIVLQGSVILFAENINTMETFLVFVFQQEEGKVVTLSTLNMYCIV